MAIVHFAMKSDADAPPSADHADYITRSGKWVRLDCVMVESGNMPEFAAADPRQFWLAADANERANGRTYTELQIALPRELQPEQRVALARQFTHEVLGERFAYTLAVHNPSAADREEQPHFHLMFSERVVDGSTRLLPADRFFKRNGAKKDRDWHDKEKPAQVRKRWCELANQELEVAGLADRRLDHRSLADQGRAVDALLVEPKVLRRGTPEEKAARLAEIAEIREAKAVLADVRIEAPTVAALERAAAENKAALEKEIAEVEAWEKAELGKLEKLVAAVKAAGRVVGQKVNAAVQWFEQHGFAKPLEQYANIPDMAAANAAQYSRMPRLAPNEHARARWLEAGQVIREHLMERLRELGKKPQQFHARSPKSRGGMSR